MLTTLYTSRARLAVRVMVAATGVAGAALEKVIRLLLLLLVLLLQLLLTLID